MTDTMPAPARTSERFNPDWVIVPGATLRDWREERGLSAQEAALACARMPAAMFAALEDGQLPIDESIAAELADGTGISSALWLKLEQTYRDGLVAGKVDVSDPPS